MMHRRVGTEEITRQGGKMKALIRLIGVLALVAIFLLPGSTLVFASEDWVVYMTVTTDPDVGSVPGEGVHFGFGAKDGASDGYDSGEGDEIAPPDPMTGINAYFYYPSNDPSSTRNLIMSVTDPVTSITWPLRVKMVGETGDADITISWPDISSVPTKYSVLELQDTGNTTLADMRSVDHYTFSASQGLIYNFQIWAEAEEILEYDLTIDSTVGGNVTTPGEGLFPDYDAGTVVALVATPGAGYRFLNWTGDVGAIANVNGATTTITMNSSYSIVANFKAVGGCFIATAAYGTPMAEEIQILREFRDGYLLTNPLGQAFVDFYYRTSPPIAEFITEHLSLKPIVRAGLLPAVAMSTVVVNTTPTEKASIAGLLALVSVALAVWITRRRDLPTVL
jgi:hypothetical protein